MNQIDLTGRHAVVTGGGQGIGRAIAERLLASGAAVSLWDRDEALINAVAVELSKDGAAVRYSVVDVSKQADVDATMAALRPFQGDVIQTNLDSEAEEALRRALD